MIERPNDRRGWRIGGNEQLVTPAPGTCLQFFADLEGADLNGEQLKGCERLGGLDYFKKAAKLALPYSVAS